MNPYLIVGALLLAIGAFFFGRSTGADAERTAWQARENVELVAANAKIMELQEAARAKERAQAVALQDASAVYEGKLANERKKVDGLRAAARAGTFRLRDVAGGEKTCGSVVPATGAPSGERDGPARTELSGAATDFLLALTGEADAVVQQLSACQRVVRAYAGESK